MNNVKFKSTNMILDQKLESSKKIDKAVKMPTPWYIQNAYNTTVKQGQMTFSCLFQTNKKLIQNMLIIKDTDYHLHVAITKLYNKYQSMALMKQLNPEDATYYIRNSIKYRKI